MGLPGCREVTRRLSREMDETAPARRSVRVRMHLLICSACRRYARQVRWLRATLRRLAPTLGALPDERRERIRRAIRGRRDR